MATLARMVESWAGVLAVATPAAEVSLLAQLLPVLALVVGAGLGYVGHYLQARTPTRDNKDTLDEARKARVQQHMQWAMDKMVSDDELTQGLGARQLDALLESPHLTDEERSLILAATSLPLELALEEWDDGEADRGREETP